MKHLVVPGGGEVTVLGFFPDFASPAGAFVELSLWLEERDPDLDYLVAAISSAGVWFSIVNDGAFRSDSWRYFREMLKDWGYFGSRDQGPDWRTRR